MIACRKIATGRRFDRRTTCSIGELALKISHHPLNEVRSELGLLAREEGLLVGISSGCNVYAATLLARELAGRGEPATIVTVLCDSADKYLSEPFWDEA